MKKYHFPENSSAGLQRSCLPLKGLKKVLRKSCLAIQLRNRS